MSRPLAVEDRIQWHEGMLLSPQHFQLASARVDTLVAWHTLAAAPFAWGIRELKIDSALVPAGIVRVLRLEAIMPDGTAVSFAADNPLHGSLQLDLAPFAQALGEGPVDFYLVLPVNKSMRDPGAPSRFRSVVTAPADDEVSDALAADVPRLLPNLSLVAGTPPSGLYTSMRLGTLLNNNELIKIGDALPPLLEMPKDSDLWAQVSALAGQLRVKAAFVAKQTAVPSSRTEDRLAYIEQRERLRNLLTGLPQLEAVLRSPGLHPFALYLSLCSLLGPLSMLKPGALPPVPPEYDHADPVSVFRPLLLALEDSLQEVSQEYREHKFEFRYGAFELGLQPDWLTQQLVLGLRGRPEKDLIAWMSGAIVGSQSAYGSLRERRVLGAARTHIESSEELGVRSSSGYTLFAIQPSASITLPNEPLIVSNSAESVSAQRPQEMVLFVKG
jgi:type VI secretion system protein ImpJ